MALSLLKQVNAYHGLNRFVVDYTSKQCINVTNLRAATSAYALTSFKRHQTTNATETLKNGRDRDAAKSRVTAKRVDIRDLELPDFTDPKIAYGSKSMQDLIRAYMVFRLCGYDVLVNQQDKVRRSCFQRLF